MINFSCKLIGHGWIEVNLASEENEVTMIASYLSNAPYELIITLALLSEGIIDETMFLWKDEPGEYRWMFKNQNDFLELKVLHLQAFSNKNDQIIFIGKENLGRFVHRVLREFNAIKKNYSTDDYKNLWGHEFPLDALNRLSAAIKK